MATKLKYGETGNKRGLTVTLMIALKDYTG
jgi:hypothetical protein